MTKQEREAFRKQAVITEEQWSVVGKRYEELVERYQRGELLSTDEKEELEELRGWLKWSYWPPPKKK